MSHNGMDHKHKLLILHGGPILAFVCELHWCDVEIFISRGKMRQMTVKGRRWRNEFKRGGNYPLVRSAGGQS